MFGSTKTNAGFANMESKLPNLVLSTLAFGATMRHSQMPSPSPKHPSRSTYYSKPNDAKAPETGSSTLRDSVDRLSRLNMNGGL